MAGTIELNLDNDRCSRILQRAEEAEKGVVTALRQERLWRLGDKFLILYRIVSMGVTDLRNNNKLVMSLCRHRSNRVEEERNIVFDRMRKLLMEAGDGSVCDDVIWNEDVKARQAEFMFRRTGKLRKEAAAAKKKPAKRA